ncbi:histidine triad domain-containing protein [Oleiphilus messinensis]|uniref:Histidine triad domain-containing protein n=1 Tax=Oleiphilus messinensis TaxID=141451 RepID=A0A1Y0I678_9GAMM|nr:HIT family protein [Oleiphilus messinensis]ARU55997.1 histidine triad domain-containing protein [Oleiphilus messinensis]
MSTPDHKIDDNCIFCQIAANKAPAAKVHEDQHCIAFMDLYPLGLGHVLVIPKTHAVKLEELDHITQSHLFKVANAVIDAQRKCGLGCQGTHLLVNDGKAAHQTVPHAHVHLIPRQKGDILKSTFRLVLHITGMFGLPANRKKLEAQASQINQHLNLEPTQNI